MASRLRVTKKNVLCADTNCSTVVSALVVLVMLSALCCVVASSNVTVNFAFIGDFGSAAQGASERDAEAEVLARTLSWNPSFIVSVGDNNYPVGEANTLQEK